MQDPQAAEQGPDARQVGIVGMLGAEDHVEMTRNTKLQASLSRINQKFSQMNDTLDSGELFLDAIYDEGITSGGVKVVADHGPHTFVFGVDMYKGTLDQKLIAGSELQSYPEPYGLPPVSVTRPDIASSALYLNDSILLGNFSFTPGIRFDHNDISGSFISPSLGMTYIANENTVLRVSVARGFTTPPLGFSEGGGLLLDPNPDLTREEVWSSQFGFETGAFRFFWLPSCPMVLRLLYWCVK